MQSILKYGQGRCLTALSSVVAVAISMTACSSARYAQPSTGADRTTAAIEAHLRQAALDNLALF